MLFVPITVSLATEQGEIIIVFDLTDDNNNVSITNIVVSSLSLIDLPRFLFLGEDKGHFYLYTRTPILKNGVKTTIKEHIPETLLTKMVVDRLLKARDEYIDSRQQRQ